jgi:hypothetical protein
MSQNFIVKTLDEDRFARTTHISLGEKAIQTPNFCSLVQRNEELNSLIKLSLFNESKHLGAYVVRVFDAPNIILPRLQNKGQRDIISGKSLEELFISFSQKNILFIDPALEYLLYEFHARKFLGAIRKIRTGKQLDVLVRYLEERDSRREEFEEEEYEIWKKAHHKKFWYDLDRNQLDKGKFVGDSLALETLCGSEISIPPVPIVDSEGLLDIAIRINILARAIAPRTKPCATYFLLQKSVLRNDALVDKIIAFLKADPTQLTIIKIKNLDLWNAGYVRQRESYRKLMDAMFQIRKQSPTKLFMALENWYVSFASACYGFNIVSTSMHGFDRDSDFGTNAYGSWFDPDLMYYIPFEELKNTVLKNTHNNLMPCYCPICKSIKNLAEVDKDNWNMLRREHYTLTMNEYMRMISQAISDRNIELAREKLANSQLALLQTLIPRT